MSVPTPRERFLRLIFNQEPYEICDPFECFNCSPNGLPYLLDATAEAHRRTGKGGRDVPDAWGVIWDWPDDQPGPTPNHAPDKIVVKDITKWRDYVTYPDLDSLDWTSTDKLAATVDRETKLVMAQSPRGPFEYTHAMLGFEAALESFLLEQEDMYDFIGEYTDWKIKAAGLCIDHLKPDIIVNFDDWGSKHQLFLPPQVWRDVMKPHYERFFGYIKSRGVITMNHCDCYAEDICTDMVDVHIDVWQGVTPQNDLPAIVEKTEGKLLLFGGIDMPLIDYPGVTEGVVRSHIRQQIEKYAPTRRYEPIFSSWMPVYPNVMAWARKEFHY